MEIRAINQISGGQDGAIWGRFLFRFKGNGTCLVYDLDGFNNAVEPVSAISSFVLDKADVLAPHSNAVMFGNEYYCPGDEFPLLYSNVYNNYAGAEDPRKGVCCVYRLQRSGDSFTTTMVQLIEIGFLNEGDRWYSSEAHSDVRPYGNFAIDRAKGIYYAFTMRDACKTTRYFSFQLPKARDGVLDEQLSVKRLSLPSSAIIDFFDCPYHYYIQGACTHGGKIYSLEGFSDSADNPPAIRVIDPERKCQERCVAFGDFGMTIEPEFIDFREETCYYGDAQGNLYNITF